MLGNTPNMLGNMLRDGYLTHRSRCASFTRQVLPLFPFLPAITMSDERAYTAVGEPSYGSGPRLTPCWPREDVASQHKPGVAHSGSWPDQRCSPHLTPYRGWLLLYQRGEQPRGEIWASTHPSTQLSLLITILPSKLTKWCKVLWLILSSPSFFKYNPLHSGQ